LNIRFIVVLTVLTHLSFAGCRVIISLTAGAAPFAILYPPIATESAGARR